MKKKVFSTILLIFLILIFISLCILRFTTFGNFILFWLWASAVAKSQPPAIEDYVNYICYDNHLLALETGKTIGRYYNDENFQHFYSKIKDISDTQFISARVNKFLYFGGVGTFVLQNPENYVDVKTDWTVKEIVFYIKEKTVRARSKVEYTDKVLYTTSEDNYINGITSLWANTESDPSNEKIIRERSDNSSFMYDDGEWFLIWMRTEFNESESLVWETTIYPQNDFYAMQIKTKTDTYSFRSRYYVIDNDSVLYELITEAEETIRDAHGKK